MFVWNSREGLHENEMQEVHHIIITAITLIRIVQITN
jgi:hypothetical protein